MIETTAKELRIAQDKITEFGQKYERDMAELKQIHNTNVEQLKNQKVWYCIADL